MALEEKSNDASVDTPPSSSSAVDRAQRSPEGGLLEVSDSATSKEDHGWRRIVRNFTPSWFSVTMGTGMVSIILHSLPYNAAWIRVLSIGVFGLNILIFAAAFLVSLVRYALYPEIWSAMLRHPTQSLFLGTLPMGFATIINMMVLVLVPVWGEWVTLLAWALWWVDAAVSVVICCYLAWSMIAYHETNLQSVTAVYLLPIVTCIVASATGALLAPELSNPQHALWTIVASYALWGIGVPLAMMILAIYYYRLMMHGLPSRDVIVSAFLPLGPLGQGSFAIMKLGRAAVDILPQFSSLPVQIGDVCWILGICCGLWLWAMALPWACFAIGAVAQSKFPFNMGWWGFTFPIGTVVMATIQIGLQFDSPFFRVLGEILGVTVVFLWCIVFALTVRNAYTGEMFFAPCLSSLASKTESQRKQ